ncbi:putative 5-dehydro-4-deoxyglucarate dehydratase OS=Castellaniella defragrans OX=75697 GN=HNR28_001542 PE=3 SV=1 [Castellaniella defragrans]
MISFQELKGILADGLMSFPVTDFDANGDFNAKGYQARLEWLMPYGASVLFAAGGTGEYFSLTLDEYSKVVETAVKTCEGHTPILAGAGGPTRNAIAFAREAQRKGAAGVLLMPHYLTDAPQDGIARHVREVCQSVDFGVILYNRGQCRLKADVLEQLADECPNLIGFKDGVGDIENMVRVHRRLGDRFAYLGGLPTAEVYAEAYRALGVPVYSSAVFTTPYQPGSGRRHCAQENDQWNSPQVFDALQRLARRRGASRCSGPRSRGWASRRRSSP